METPVRKTSDAQIAYLLLRATIGMNILMHGVSRLYVGTSHFVAEVTGQFQAAPLPHSLLVAFGHTLPWVEAVLGFLLLIGLFTRTVLILGALVILVLTFGSGLIEDWNGVGIQLLYAAVYAALLVFLNLNRFAVDALFGREQDR